MSGDFINGNIAWFIEGELNASYNCVDRHAFATPDKVSYNIIISKIKFNQHSTDCYYS